MLSTRKYRRQLVLDKSPWRHCSSQLDYKACETIWLQSSQSEGPNFTSRAYFFFSALRSCSMHPQTSCKCFFSSPLSLQRTKRNSAAQSLTSVSMSVIRRTSLFLRAPPTSGLLFTSRSGGSTYTHTQIHTLREHEYRSHSAGLIIHLLIVDAPQPSTNLRPEELPGLSVDAGTLSQQVQWWKKCLL